jgi:hypothetical protein
MSSSGGTSGGGAISKVFGRTGNIVAQSGDYTAAQVGADASGTSAAETTRAEAAEAARMVIATYDPAGIDQQLVGTVAAQQLTNKRITKRTLTISVFSATPTYDTDNCDAVFLNGITGAITSMTVNATGTPNLNDTLEVLIIDSGSSEAITWGANFTGTNVPLPTATTPSTLLRVMFQWSTLSNKWECVASSVQITSLSNVRITERVLELSANSATPAIDTDNFDAVHITGQTAAITSMTTNLSGTANDGDKLRISITGTASVAITWGADFESSTVSLPTTTSGTNRLDVQLLWNTETSKWRCVGVA